jgi:hypothetical protein
LEVGVRALGVSAATEAAWASSVAAEYKNQIAIVRRVIQADRTPRWILRPKTRRGKTRKGKSQ